MSSHTRILYSFSVFSPNFSFIKSLSYTTFTPTAISPFEFSLGNTILSTTYGNLFTKNSISLGKTFSPFFNTITYFFLPVINKYPSLL